VAIEEWCEHYFVRKKEKSVATSLLNEKGVTLLNYFCHVPVPADEGDQLVWDGNTNFSLKLEQDAVGDNAEK